MAGQVPAVPPPIDIGIAKSSLAPEVRAKVEDSVAARDFEKTKALLLGELAKKPGSAELLTLLGRFYFINKRFEETVEAMRKADSMSALPESDRFTMAVALFLTSHPEDAATLFQKLAAAAPKNPLYPYWIGQIEFKRQRWDSAVAAFRRAVALDPDYLRAYSNLGLSLEAVNQNSEAVKVYEEENRRNRSMRRGIPIPALDMGAFLEKQGDLQGAEKYLRESLTYNPTFTPAHYRLGMVLEKEKKIPEAIREMERAVSSDRDYPEAHYALGRLYQRQGKTEEAQHAMDEFQRTRKLRYAQ